MKTFAWNALLLGLAMITACNVGQPVYRANVKLLVTTAGPDLPASNLVREDDDRFIETQVNIMLSQTLLRRAQQRLGKTVEDVRDNLADLKVAPVRGADIIVISVASRSADFAKDFANTLAQEYLAFRDEQRAQTAESAMLQLTREVKRLGEELNAANSNILAYAREHGATTDVATAEALQGLRDERDQIRSLHDVLLGQLMKIDATQSLNVRTVTILETAILEPKPVRVGSQ